MKRALFLITVVLAAWPGRAAEDVSKQLQTGLFEEEANQNLPAAIEAYQAVIRQLDEQRKLGATAVFRLGECYRKLGRTNDAVQQYQRVLTEFSDQPSLKTLSEQNLYALGVAPEQPSRLVTSSRLPTASQISLLQAQAELAEKQLAEARKKVEAGVISPGMALMYERELLRLNRQLLLAKYTPEHPKVQELMQQEIQLQEQVVKEVQNRLAVGKATPGEELEQQRELLALKQEHANVKSQPVTQSSLPVTDEEEKEVRRIQALIRNSPDLINAPDGVVDGVGVGKTLLHKAAAAGQLRVVGFLLDHKAALEGRDKNSRTPLFDAVEAGHKAMVELLLQRGADANARGNNASTPLHVAAGRGFTAVMETLLANKADPKAKARWEETPLHAAVDGDQKEAALLLLKHGADVDAMKTYDISRNKPSDVRFGTPLHLGVWRYQASMVELLLEHGAKVEVRDPEGLTPLQAGARRGASDAVGLLLASKANPNAIVDKGELRDWTVLNLAVGLARDNATVELLLRQGADPNLRNGVNANQRAQTTPLGLAIESGIVSLVELLLKGQADPNAMAFGNQPPLSWAVNLDRTEIVDLLLTHGARIDTMTVDGKSVLAVAVLLDNLKMTGLFLARGANPNLQDSDGSTPLHNIVADSVSPKRNNRPGPNQEAIMRALLEHKADPNIRNHAGLSPLNLLGVPAKPDTTHRMALAKLLREHGALDERPELAPQPDVIRIWREGQLEGREIFRRGTNWNNRFTLAEALLEAYPTAASGTRFFGGVTVSGIPGAAVPSLPGRLNRTPYTLGFEWPDLSRITLRRLRPDKSYHHVEINLLNKSNVVDLTKNIPLEFGDVIEIPERLHALSEGPVGLTDEQARQLTLDPPAKAALVVGGQSTELILPHGARRYLLLLLQTAAAQAALRSTSDLSRVRVRRQATDANSPKASKVTTEFKVNETEPRNLHDDLLIENGDIIEVPDR